MWELDRRICPSGSPFVITRQASRCQSVILGKIFYPTLTLMMDSNIIAGLRQLQLPL